MRWVLLAIVTIIVGYGWYVIVNSIAQLLEEMQRIESQFEHIRQRYDRLIEEQREFDALFLKRKE